VSILAQRGNRERCALEQYTLDHVERDHSGEPNGWYSSACRAVVPMKKLRPPPPPPTPPPPPPCRLIIKISSVEGCAGGAYLHGYVASKFASAASPKSALAGTGWIRHPREPVHTPVK